MAMTLCKYFKIILENNQEFKSLLRENDVFVLDRGFRDIVDDLKTKGYNVLMPALKGKRNQLTTKESNHSRKVTKVRWAVESVHGVIGQKNKLLHHQFDNKSLEKATPFCKIACFLDNEFGKRFHSDVGMTDEIVDRMNKQSQEQNTLAREAESERWSRRKTQFEPLKSQDLGDFPELMEKELKVFFTGTYQLKQAVSYLAEMIDENGVLQLYFLKATPVIIKVQVRSRHVRSKTYNCYIHYSPDTNNIEGIRRWCCECANGKRTIGSCSHIAAVIFYLSNGRYRSRLISPSQILSDLFTQDDAIPVIDEDSDNDD